MSSPRLSKGSPASQLRLKKLPGATESRGPRAHEHQGYGIAPGNPADIIVLDTGSGRDAIAELPDVLMGFKNRQQVFERQEAVLMRPV
jgi:cytosine/adenosine deaminase-related metal-dependent hydrolase